MTKAELVLNSCQDLVQNFGRVIGTVSSKATANSTCLQSEMKGSMPLSDGSLAVSTLSTRSDLEKYVQDAVSHFMSKLHELQGNKIDLGLWLQLSRL